MGLYREKTVFSDSFIRTYLKTIKIYTFYERYTLIMNLNKKLYYFVDMVNGTALRRAVEELFS